METKRPVKQVTNKIAVDDFIAEYNRVMRWFYKTYPNIAVRFDTFYNKGAQRLEFIFIYKNGGKDKSLTYYIFDHVWKSSPEYLKETLDKVYPELVSAIRKDFGDCV